MNKKVDMSEQTYHEEELLRGFDSLLRVIFTVFSLDTFMLEPIIALGGQNNANE